METNSSEGEEINKAHLFFHQEVSTDYKNHFVYTVGGNELIGEGQRVFRGDTAWWLNKIDHSVLEDYLDDCYFDYVPGMISPFDTKNQTALSSVDGYEIHLHTNKDIQEPWKIESEY